MTKISNFRIIKQVPDYITKSKIPLVILANHNQEMQQRFASKLSES